MSHHNEQPLRFLSEESAWSEQKELQPWPTPRIEDIVPGMVVSVQDLHSKSIFKIEIVSKPAFSECDGWAAEIRGKDSVRMCSLASFGLAPNYQGRWSDFYKPLKWEMEIKEKSDL